MYTYVVLALLLFVTLTTSADPTVKACTEYYRYLTSDPDPADICVVLQCKIAHPTLPLPDHRHKALLYHVALTHPYLYNDLPDCDLMLKYAKRYQTQLVALANLTNLEIPMSFLVSPGFAPSVQTGFKNLTLATVLSNFYILLPLLSLPGTLLWVNFFYSFVTHAPALGITLPVQVHGLPLFFGLLSLLIEGPVNYYLAVLSLLYCLAAASASYLTKIDLDKHRNITAPSYLTAFFLSATLYWVSQCLSANLTVHPLTKLIPVLVALLSTAFLSNYAYVLSGIAWYAYPTFVSLFFCHLFFYVTYSFDAIPLEYRGLPLSQVFLPKLIAYFDLLSTSTTIFGVITDHADHLINTILSFSIPPSTEEGRALLTTYREWSITIWYVLTVAAFSFSVPLQRTYLSLRFYMGHTYLAPILSGPTSTTKMITKTFWKQLYASLSDPISIATPFVSLLTKRTHFIAMSVFHRATSGDHHNTLVDDLFAIVLLYNSMSVPGYFLYYVFAFFSFWVINFLLARSEPHTEEQPSGPAPATQAVPDVEANLANKLAELRRLFPKGMTVHQYLDHAPDDTIHSLYTTHVTGTRVSSPIPIRVARPNANTVHGHPTDMDSRLTRLEQILSNLQPPAPTTPPTPLQPLSAPSQPRLKKPKAQSFFTVQSSTLDCLLPTADSVTSKVVSCLRLLKAGNKIFQGFYANQKTIATVYHGLKDHNGPITCNQTVLENPNVISVPSADLAFITHVAPGPFLSFRRTAVTPGTTLHLYGLTPTNVVHSLGACVYSEDDVLLAHLASRPGLSGGIIVDDDNRLVSMHQASNGIISASLPVATIRQHYNQHIADF